MNNWITSIPSEAWTALILILLGILSVFWIFDWHPFRELFPGPGTRTPTQKKQETNHKKESPSTIRRFGQRSGIPGSIAYRRKHDPKHSIRHTRKRRIST